MVRDYLDASKNHDRRLSPSRNLIGPEISYELSVAMSAKNVFILFTSSPGGRLSFLLRPETDRTARQSALVSPLLALSITLFLFSATSFEILSLRRATSEALPFRAALFLFRYKVFTNGLTKCGSLLPNVTLCFGMC